MVTMNMPVGKEKALENQAKGDGNPLIYTPAPVEAGKVFTNELIIGLMLPGKWKMFNPDQSMIDICGMTGAGICLPGGEELVTFYLKLPVHGIPNYKRQDGSIGYTFVVCPNAMNEYLRNTFSGAPMFHDSVQCAFCQEQNRWWEVSNARWEELGIGVWDLKGKAREDKVRSDPVLSNASSMARNYRITDRYAMSVYDYSKYTSGRPLDEGQTYVTMQVWFSPKGVFESLRSHHEEGWDFWNLEKPEGVQVVKITKDTTEVTKQQPWKTSYSVTMAPQRLVIPPDLSAYIQNPDNQVDPSNFVTISSYEAMVAHIQGQNQPPASTQNRTYSTPTQPVGPPPTQSVPQTVAAPANAGTTPYVPPSAPPSPTVPVAVSGPSPIPAAPPIATTPQVGTPPIPTAPQTVPVTQPSTPPGPPIPGTPPIPTQPSVPASPPIPGQPPIPTVPVTAPANPIPAIPASSTPPIPGQPPVPNRTPPQDGGAAEPPIVPTGSAPGLGGKSW